MMIRRILLKVSGEALSNRDDVFDHNILSYFSQELLPLVAEGVEVGIVCGGGNIFRGLPASRESSINRVAADQIGMMATLLNGLMLRASLEEAGCPCDVYSSFAVGSILPTFDARNAIAQLQKKRVVIVSGGTGNPYFSTDTAGALRALELQADYLVKATKVDGVFDRDPVHHPDAVKFSTLSLQDALEKNLKVMDLTALALCADNRLPVYVYNFFKSGELRSFIAGAGSGTYVS